MQGVSVPSHVLEHVASSQLSIPSVPSGSSTNSEQRNRSTVPAAPSALAPTQSVGSTKSRKGFPPPIPVPKPQPQQNPDSTGAPAASASAAAAAVSLLQPHEADNVPLVAQNEASSSTGDPGGQQTSPQAEHGTNSRAAGNTGGRRWFRMFGSPAKCGLDGMSQKLNGGTQSAFAPEAAQQAPQQPQTRPSGVPVGPSVEDLRRSNGSGNGQADDLRRISSEVALRRVGPHAVFNPTTMMSPGDAKFLDDLRRESSVGPEATSSNVQATQQRTNESLPRASGGNNAIVQQSAQPESLPTPGIGPAMLAKVVESPSDKQSGQSQSHPDSDAGSRGATDYASSAEFAAGNRHVFQM